MRFKRTVKSILVLCITAILAVAVCGCDDLGAYENTDAYYSAFGDVVLIGGTTREVKEYSVKDYFYSRESRENFLKGEDGAYKGVAHSDYVYIAIPFESDIDMDTLALYIQSQNEVTVYINVFVSDAIPTAWRGMADNEATQNASSDDGSGEESKDEEKTYDDPAPEARIGEVTVHLNAGKWNSFVLDFFKVNGTEQKSIQIKDGQYILLQIRNNSGVRVFDQEKQAFVDPQTGLELPRAQITVTNLLIRALEVKNAN